MINFVKSGPLLSTGASLVFLLAGAVALYTMMTRMGKKELPNPELFSRIHRIAGWIFTAMFVGLFIYMLTRLANYTEEFSSRITIHFTLSVALLCLLAIKITIARNLPLLGKNLFSLGVAAYLLAFSLVLITAGYHVERLITAKPYVYHGEFDKEFADERLGKEFLITKCSPCHVLQTILKPRSEKAWGNVVTRMVALAKPRISSGEGSQILAYLEKNFSPRLNKIPENASQLEKHCFPCHEAKDIYKTPYGLTAWKVIIKKMSQFDEEIVPLDKVDEIAEYLVKNQEK